MRGKMIYRFSDGDPNDKALLGGKGAGLARMVRLGLPVTSGFIITTEQCVAFFADNHQWPKGLDDQVCSNIAGLEMDTDKVFGDANDPLLVSVRSGARASMPGMMDTVLNLGLNDQTVKGLAVKTDNERFALDSYRRFIMMYSSVVFGMSKEPFEHALDAEKQKEHVSHDHELSVKGLRVVVQRYKNIVKKADHIFPQDVYEQLRGAINAVFLSWNNERAVFYRHQENIPDEWGTAVTVQAMVFGNMGGTSGTGVAFSRNPSTGKNELFCEWMQNAQGEDVVAGVRTPQPGSASVDSNGLSLEEMMPEVYAQLLSIKDTLEEEYRDMVDMEFTIENGTLYMLQVRVGKRTGAAAVRMAVEMVKEELISIEEALKRITTDHVAQMLHSVLQPGDRQPLISGLNASPGAAVGRAVFTAADAVAWHGRDQDIILVRSETSPEDIHGMSVAKGILTATGGRTSHAAVVGRQMGKPCVVGCNAASVDALRKLLRVGSHTVPEGEWLSLDGSTGHVYLGKVAQVPPVMTPEFMTMLHYCNGASSMEVWANADTPEDAQKAYDFGAAGIGLVRIEHMSFGLDRLPIMQNIILHLNHPEQHLHYVSMLEPYFREDFEQLFTIFKNKPVTIRLMDPPLHEFIPNDEKLKDLGYEGIMLEALKHMRNTLHEQNPMMGHRGCRLSITHPALCAMQIRAIINAACDARESQPKVKIMIPLVVETEELVFLKTFIDDIANMVMTHRDVTVDYTVGVMIETPAAALIAAELAVHADFFSFGTNDLTQLTFAFSRDDAGKFLPAYLEKGILKEDPFVSIDEKRVGALLRYAVNKARKINPELSIGICGEHGGDPKSVTFFNSLGLDYVSCSPYRIPDAALAAAQAEITARARIAVSVEAES